MFNSLLGDWGSARVIGPLEVVCCHAESFGSAAGGHFPQALCELSGKAFRERFARMCSGL